jgi:hypothetical protein
MDTVTNNFEWTLLYLLQKLFSVLWGHLTTLGIRVGLGRQTD